MPVVFQTTVHTKIILTNFDHRRILTLLNPSTQGRYDTIYLELGTKFGLRLTAPATWTFLTAQTTVILQTDHMYILGERELVIRSFGREQEGFYRATTEAGSHLMFYVRMVQGQVEEEVSGLCDF